MGQFLRMIVITASFCVVLLLQNKHVIMCIASSRPGLPVVEMRATFQENPWQIFMMFM